MNRPVPPGFNHTSLALPEAVLRPGETLVAIDHLPVAFPGVLEELPNGVIDGPGRVSRPEQGCYRDVGVRFRRSVAQWIGVHQEAFYGSAQYKHIWDGDRLTIDDDPWRDYDVELWPIEPDEDGLYLIDEPWFAVSARYATKFHRRHPVALAILAGDDQPSAVDEMLSYLADVPGEHPRLRDRIEAVLADRLPS